MTTANNHAFPPPPWPLPTPLATPDAMRDFPPPPSWPIPAPLELSNDAYDDEGAW